MKKVYNLIFTAVLFAACSKTGTSTTNAGTDGTGTGTNGSTTGAGTGTATKVAVNVWQLAGIAVDYVPKSLTTMQSTYKMSLSTDNRFSDTDGVIGSWGNPTKDSLVIVQSNIPTPITLRYKITSSNATTLTLSKTVSGTQIDLKYEAR